MQSLLTTLSRFQVGAKIIYFYPYFEPFAQRTALSFQALGRGRFPSPRNTLQVLGSRGWWQKCWRCLSSPVTRTWPGWINPNIHTLRLTLCQHRAHPGAACAGLDTRDGRTDGRSDGQGRARGSAAGAGHALITLHTLLWFPSHQDSKRDAQRADTALEKRCEGAGAGAGRCYKLPALGCGKRKESPAPSSIC